MDRQMNNLVEELYPTLIEWRRDFHKFAESGWVEFRTASKVAARLAEWGYQVKVGQAVVDRESRMGLPAESFLRMQEERALEQGADPDWLPFLSGGFTGVVGLLDTGRPGSTIAFRVDMDALDIQESPDQSHIPNVLGFHSVNPHMMHACGHDAHTTIGLGLAYTLMNLKNSLHGRIKLIFQPAEEGVRGAKSMVAAGIVDDVDYFFACHIGTGIPLGEFVCGANGYLATTKVDVTYHGVASHAGGKPEEGKNALLAAATAVLNLHSISRHSSGVSRINVGVLQAGSGRNIIPNTAAFKLETRGETTEVNEFILQRAMEIIKGAAAMYGVEEEIAVVGKAGSSESSAQILPYIHQQAEKVVEIHSIVDLYNTSGSEDATYMMEHVKQNGGLASYMIFGTTLSAGHHNEKFDIDESVLKIAVKTLSLCALHVKKLEHIKTGISLSPTE